MRVYDENSLTIRTSFQAHLYDISRIELLANGLVATCSHDITVKLWEPSSPSWQLIQAYPEHGYINTDTIASAGSIDGIVQFWSISSGQTKQTINVGSGVLILCLKVLTDGLRLAVGLGSLGASSDNEIIIYSLITGSLVGSLKGQTYVK